jgi:OmpA-OmpF porin, OOP family
MQLFRILALVLTILWFVLGARWYANSQCTSCATASPPAAENLALPGFSIADGNWNLGTTANLKFGKSTQIPVISANIALILDSLAQYAKLNPFKVIKVTGYYSADEKNNTSFGDLGLARADELKKYLIAKGLTESSMATNSQMENTLVFNSADTLIGGIAINLDEVSKPELVEAPKEDLFQPRTVYFKTGDNSLPIDADLAAYLEKANVYLKSHMDKKLSIIGYTDNVGNADFNLNLSKRRAAFVKSELANKGIANDHMESLGKGMEDPIADNTTDEGKQKNRRVTIQLK